jgi:ABC-type transport system involved in cytochrome bd biosynthesis fused ATPase/permease subunit
MHHCQVCDAPHLMAPQQGVARCPNCGNVEHTASTRPLFVVTGASGSGKTTLFPLLLDRLAGQCGCSTWTGSSTRLAAPRRAGRRGQLAVVS